MFLYSEGKMVNRLLGSYFLNKNVLTEEQLENVYDTQKKSRVKLGLIAVSEKLMTEEQAAECNKLQSMKNKRFGDIAVEKGYLTEDQVLRLLGLQVNPYLSFVQAIVDNEYMTFDEVEAKVNEYKNEKGFSLTDMDALKSGDIERIVPLFLPPEVNMFQMEHILVCVKTILRLVDNDIYFDKGYFTDHVDTDFYALQSIDGDSKATLAFIAKGNAILPLAETFGDEEFGEVDVYALDAVAEFINCVNGMYTSDLENVMDLDMLPPDYKVDPCVLSGKILVLPVYVKGEMFNIISGFGEFIKVD